jgi:pSer/pThr/pTyr-binding forkhead associated (FHA) protein
MPFLYRITSEGVALRRWKIDSQPLVIGRSNSAAVCIPDYRLSGEHFSIARANGQFVIEDLDSKNGTFVNGQRITRQTLHCDDRIVAGHTLFSFEAGLSTMIHVLEKAGPREERDAPLSP